MTGTTLNAYLHGDSRNVKIREGVVYKQGDLLVLHLEALKMRLASAIGEKTGLFSVPRVLDSENGTLATEFLPNLKNLREIAIERRSESEEIFRRAGRALAAVHRELTLPVEQIVSLPDYLMSGTSDNVVLHGDFFWGNISWDSARERLVLLDWAAAPVLGGLASYGSRYFDLLWFSWTFFFWTPPRWVFRLQPDQLVTALNSGYAEIGPRLESNRYINYRAAIRPLVIRYWKTKHKRLPSSLPHTIAEIIGSARWLLYSPPRNGKKVLGGTCASS